MHPHSFRFLTLFTAFLTTLPSLASAGAIQVPGLTVPPEHSKHRDDVKTIFVKSFQAYHDHAYGHDELAPVSQGFRDTRNGWGATIVDAMSTMFVMGLTDWFDDSVKFATSIDFSQSKTDDLVSVFESTIRYMGGLLSAYELSGQHNSALVARAKQLGDKLAFAWVGNNVIPYGHLNFITNQPQQENSNIAEAGTLAMEWSLLSDFTGNATYRALSEKSLRHVATSTGPLPGLPAQGIDPSSGSPVGDYVTWGGGSDSYFEYLIKYPRLTNTDDPVYVTAWKTAVDSSIKHLLKTSTVGGHVYLGDYQPGSGVIHVSSHLACFHGGNWIFGGKLLNNKTIVDYGIQLTDACWNTYASTATGLGPEVFGFQPTDGPTSGDPHISADQQTFYLKNGFYITASDYYMRPEVLESNFYAWRTTGDTKYLDRAASAINSINTHLAVNGAFAPILDVNSVGSRKFDVMESFWFAEVLKYLYLTFDDPSKYSLDEYIFNTEAQLFKAPAAKQTYDTGKFAKSSVPFKTKQGAIPKPSAIPLDIGAVLSSILG